MIDAVQFTELRHEMLAIFSLDGDFLEYDLSWVEFLGCKNSALKNQNLKNFLYAEDQNKWSGLILSASSVDVLQFMGRCRHKDGDYRYLDWRCQLAKKDKKIYALARDTTLFRRKISKVSHEINNSLAVVQGFIQLLPSQIDKKTTLLDRINRIQASAQKLALAVKELKKIATE